MQMCREFVRCKKKYRVTDHCSINNRVNALLYEKAINYKDICGVFTTNSVHLFKQSNKKYWKTVLFRCLDLIYYTTNLLIFNEHLHLIKN